MRCRLALRKQIWPAICWEARGCCAAAAEHARSASAPPVCGCQHHQYPQERTLRASLLLPRRAAPYITVMHCSHAGGGAVTYAWLLLTTAAAPHAWHGELTNVDSHDTAAAQLRACAVSC